MEIHEGTYLYHLSINEELEHEYRETVENWEQVTKVGRLYYYASGFYKSQSHHNISLTETASEYRHVRRSLRSLDCTNPQVRIITKEEFDYAKITSACNFTIPLTRAENITRFSHHITIRSDHEIKR